MITSEGKYQMVEAVYSSRNTNVFKALDTQTGQNVILKTINHDDYNPINIPKLKNEYRLLEKLGSQYVVNVYELLRVEDRFSIVMEDFGGISLSEYMKSDSPGLVELLDIALKTTACLDHIHRNAIIHKDINPSNIVYNPDSGIIKIIDPGIASEFSSETIQALNPNTLEGTLAYISPEQTGRMNRTVDYRTDFYSFGVTLYQLLTGRTPFITDDPMEMVHCHIAKIPEPVSLLNPEIPGILSDIVMKLLNKNAENRYQSAFGLRYDLEQVFQAVQSGLTPPDFKLGQRDVSGRFCIPQKLYGRKAEIETLLSAFERVSRAAPDGKSQSEILLVAGYSGVGKSSLVHEIYKPITERKGYFVSGKYDQYQRNLPYFALTQALNEFCNHLLTEPEASLEEWKTKSLKAVGTSGQALIEVIPNLELVIGGQPDMPAAGPRESQNRFNMVFQNFIKAISQPEHPLVIFIDDLQWVDMASLELLKQLLTDTDNRHLMLIGAYRDNEVTEGHPFMMAKAEWEKANVRIHHLELPNLTRADLTALVADTLQSEPDKVFDLVNLLYEKTQGNAFFVGQFLHALYDEKLLTFDSELPGWQWDMGKVRAKGMTDNVVELMTQKVQKLPFDTQQILQLAACVGSRFDVSVLAVVSEQSPNAIITRVLQGVQEGLVSPLDDRYKLLTVSAEHITGFGEFRFVHDRVQQASYSLIPEEQKKAVHLKIGRLLLADTPEEMMDDRIFDIVSQLNRGMVLMMDQGEKLRVAGLNLQAGLKAKTSAAYDAARNLFQEGMNILPTDSWEHYHELTFNLHIESAECEYLTGDFQKSAGLLDTTMKHAKSDIEKGLIYIQKIAQHSIKGEYIASINTGIEAFAAFGIELPPLEDRAAIQEYVNSQEKVYQEIWGDRPIADLYDLPVSEDTAQEILTTILVNLLDCGLITSPFYLPALTFTAVILSIRHGNTSNSSYAYEGHGMIMSSGYRNYDAAYEFGALGMKLNESKFKNMRVVCKVLNMFGGFLSHLKTHLKDVPVMLER